MKLSRALWESIASLLAADTTGLANAAALHVHLAAQNFVPSLDLVLGTLVEATFTGSAAKSAGIGAQTVYYDAVDGVRTIELLEPAGGWHWQCTVTPGAPETIYGYYVTDNANAVLIGSATLDNPVTISAAGQGLDIANIRLKFQATSPY